MWIQRSGRCFTLLLRQAFPEGFMPPWRIQHESHTCSEQSLRILMWNASYVQKQSSYTWQEKVEDQIREGSRRMYFKATARCNISIWTKSFPPWHQVWFENCLKNDMPVLGLAGCHFRKLISKLQVRPGEQPGYPKDTIESFVGHSSMGLLCPPA